jgi:hypothetical protein
MHIGFDLDNTIICYDSAFAAAAIAQEILPADTLLRTKDEIKQHLHAQGDIGIRQWQALQGYMYGQGIGEASIFPGVAETLQHLSETGHRLSIVSHKTHFGHYDATRTNLREAATAFLGVKGITNWIPPDRIFYCANVAEKLRIIDDIECDIFVDDLTDVLLHEDFPTATQRIAFRPNIWMDDCRRADSWMEIAAVLDELLAAPSA